MKIAPKLINQFKCSLVGLLALLAVTTPSFSEDFDTAGNYATPQTLNIEAGTAEIITLPGPVDNIFVADNKIADVQLSSPRALYVFGIRDGQTTVFASTEDGRNVLNLSVSVAPNLSRLRNMINNIAEDSKINIKAENNTIVLEGQVSSPKLAADIEHIAARFLNNQGTVINRMTITSPTQVNVRVVVAEVSRDVTRTLGINWEVIGGMSKSITWALGLGRDFVDLATGLPIGGLSLVGGTPTTSTTAVDMLRNNTGDHGIGLRYRNNVDGNTPRGGRINLSSMIDAAASEGFATIFASPNLTVLSGQTATFLSGGEFAIPNNTANSSNVQFKEFGIGLTFTATILSDNLIELKVAPSVSNIEQDTFTKSYKLNTRKASTVVQAASGQSIAIAGLLQSNIDNIINGLPGLCELPGFLGALFRSTTFRRKESELVIIVTPYLVKPANMRMGTPFERKLEASHVDRMFMGNLYSNQESDQSNRPNLIGTAGFIMD